MIFYGIFYCAFLKDLSWEKAVCLLFKVQKRLFKVTYLLDKKNYKNYKLILESNCARLLAIRDVTQLSSYKNMPGVDGHVTLSFSERYQLNEYLKANWNNWKTQSLKKVLIFDYEKNTIFKKVSTISDRAWQNLIKFSIEPVHEAKFHPANFGYRFNNSIYKVQDIILLNLSKDSFGKKKKILKIDLSKNVSFFDYSYLIKNLIAPRSIKLGIFRLLEKGFNLEFPEEHLLNSTLSSLLLNVLLNGIESFHNCIRYGYFILYFLKPLDDEKLLLNQISSFIFKRGLKIENSQLTLFSVLKSFDFLGWNFKFSEKSSVGLYSFPNFKNYQAFLKRVKRIINNSNYGSIVKASKLYPIIREWKEYHRYSDLLNLSHSLFFIKKRAFKSFNSESKQDFYSSKRLLIKSFLVSSSFSQQIKRYKLGFNNSVGFGHLTFLFEHISFSNKKKFCFCVHCGMTCL
uniref:Maturase n=1 Tax=Euglena hiemalis TaxID=392896 RepID=A0A345UC32_9EUGL|nr:maturase [Euglena hiemalis]AXI98018.1 maturase [Euglena hiemalis]